MRAYPGANPASSSISERGNPASLHRNAPLRSAFAARLFGTPLPLSRSEALPLLALVLVALAIRLIWLDRVPTNVMPDEADGVVDAYHILAGTGPAPFGLDWTQLPSFSAYLMAGFMKLFGLSIVGMRMAVVVTSTLALIPFYLLVRKISYPLPAFLATLLFATGLWYLNFSRTAWLNVHPVLFELLAAWALVESLERRRLWMFGVAGVGIALTLYGYYSGRAAVMALLLYLGLVVLARRGDARRTLAGAAVTMIVAAILFYPQAETLAENWGYSNTRVESVSIFSQKTPYLGETDPGKLLVMQAERMVRAYFLMDGSLFETPRYTPEHTAPIDAATAILYAAGLILGLGAISSTGIWYLLLVVPLVVTQLFSINTPDTGRAIVVIPAIYFFVALALQFAWMRLSSGRLSSALTVLALVIALYNVWWYFDWVQLPQTASVRQPAVELPEFARWQAAQWDRAVEGEPGFTVTEWHRIR